MKTAIVYYSRHHENTKKILDTIASKNDVTLIDVTANPQDDLAEYDRIGFASGIYYSKFNKSLIEYAKEHMPDGKETFFIYTCGAKKDGYTKVIAEATAKHGAKILGEYGCLGFDSFGPFKLIGGIAKGHPTNEEIDGAVKFYEDL